MEQKEKLVNSQSQTHLRKCRENLCKLFYDFAKLTFAATTLACCINLVNGSEAIAGNLTAAALGAIATIALSVIGYYINLK